MDTTQNKKKHTKNTKGKLRHDETKMAADLIDSTEHCNIAHFSSVSRKIK
jgi:hypothetical protein